MAEFGSCIVCMNIPGHAIASTEDVTSLILLVNGREYLSAFAKKVVCHFADYVPLPANTRSDNLSFTTTDDIPVAMSCPIGVLCDLYQENGSKIRRLNLLVNFSSISTGSRAGPEVLNQIKAALVFQGRGLVEFNKLSRDHLECLQSIAVSPSETFLDVFKDLFPTNDTTPCYCSIKVHMMNSVGQVHSVVLRVANYLSDGVTLTTVRDVIARCEIDESKVTLWIQGWKAHWDTPTNFLQQYLCYGDGFVHVVCR